MECGVENFIALRINPDKVFLEKYLSVSLFEALVLGVNLVAVD